MKEEFCKSISQVFNNHGISLTPFQQEQFYNYYNLLVTWNEKFNLTTILEKDDVIIKHFLDSCVCVNLLNQNATVIDIGAGAGFPSLPLKILRPDLKIILVDSVNKKVTFLQEVIKVLNLQNVEALHSRVEDLAHKLDKREKFDYCVSRAVASLNTLSEYALPFIKVGGQMIALKSSDIEEEIKSSQKALSLLGGKLKETKKICVNNVDRKILIINKINSCPQKYPRSGNKPRLMPL